MQPGNATASIPHDGF